jgi:hypothetical protein
MRVKNLNGTTQRTCKCGSWLKHWENFGGCFATICSVDGCNNDAEVGGHVQKVGSDNKWYIIPLCKSCNNKRGEELEIDDNTELVSANVSETCEKGIGECDFEKLFDFK